MDTILVLDFGGQYCHLISRRVRDLGVFSEILPYDSNISKIMKVNPKGIILSGGPASVYENDSPMLADEVFHKLLDSRIPILGICYGHHLIIHKMKGIIKSKSQKEYGKTILYKSNSPLLLEGLGEEEIVWMSHGDQVEKLPEEFKIYAYTNTCPIASYGNEKKNLFGVQFHPEVTNTPKGNLVLENFILKIANCRKEWKLENWIENSINNIKETVADGKRVILGLSGGVDSSVTAVLLHRAIGDRLHCIFVNNGLLRKNEEQTVQKVFKEDLDFKNFHYVDAEHLFLTKLSDVTDPEDKRKIIGHSFIEVFEDETIRLEKQYPDIEFLAQGTIYPDRVETSATSKVSAKIKSHHNLTLPDDMTLIIIEPLKDLYKDEVRKIGLQLGLPERIIERHPFPGPGLAVRCIGEISKERLDTLREADHILMEEIRIAGLYKELWQVFCVYLPVKSVGIMGDFRTYDNICAIRAVESRDAMTANFAKIDWDVLEKISTRIINEVKGFNRVVYDISNKPPSTIEFE
ncbi:MAG: glutamine-hydrolyzing GMP synthase [Candidatus Lokiarchaeota archaeon]|nr:glutamine-hydrolyzing GMP synthase [Candidatus Lokiarchaeota archaeon]MBD3200638.1 glutamine-hydrolyzing GMP synthase [Candidatus Lokiarchaeota archaeon]